MSQYVFGGQTRTLLDSFCS